MMRKLFKWIFKEELKQLEAQISEATKLADKLNIQSETFNQVLSNIDISVDVHEYARYAPSWAVISLQGQKTDYIKFVDLRNSDINEISKFLRKYERNTHVKIDASPIASNFLRIHRSFRF